ncbi:hypothetical protein FLK61_34850 [Paenalkalicoccus suaedae]|uniref:Uncharacterized protein n=1 Tax=Paenalkalicoccus suaedae TaxID=2592382 RepID=A0A859FFA4_9BACI|nr:hypothetical protein [Paenalkalicoccus suaedae]QKS71849.1 hypothetical protein FLK61_34850 [Paenalkalicoccus suaedae]
MSTRLPSKLAAIPFSIIQLAFSEAREKRGYSNDHYHIRTLAHNPLGKRALIHLPMKKSGSFLVTKLLGLYSVSTLTTSILMDVYEDSDHPLYKDVVALVTYLVLAQSYEQFWFDGQCVVFSKEETSRHTAILAPLTFLPTSTRIELFGYELSERGLSIPRPTLQAMAKNHGYGCYYSFTSTHRASLASLSEKEIIAKYEQELHRFKKTFRYVPTTYAVSKLTALAEASLLKTIAYKRSTTSKKAYALLTRLGFKRPLLSRSM